FLAADGIRCFHVTGGQTCALPICRLYAGMFAAACVSVPFVADDLLEAVYVGLGEVPDESRLSRAVSAALKVHRTSGGWIEAKEQIGRGSGRERNRTTASDATERPN